MVVSFWIVAVLHTAAICIACFSGRKQRAFAVLHRDTSLAQEDNKRSWQVGLACLLLIHDCSVVFPGFRPRTFAVFQLSQDLYWMFKDSDKDF